MTRRSWLVGAAVAVLAAIAAGTAVAAVTAAGDVSVGFILITLWLGVAFAATGGLLLALRPGNLLGPALVTGGAALVLEHALRAWALGSAGPAAAGWLGQTLDPLFFPGALVVILLLFPDGRWPVGPGGRRLRQVVTVAVALTATQVALVGLRPGPIPDESWGGTIRWDGPLPLGLHDGFQRVIDGLTTFMVWLLLGAAAALLIRGRRARGLARQQYKPLALVVALLLVGLMLQVGGGSAGSEGVRAAGVTVLVLAVAAGLPVALAMSALRYRLWDLDRVIVAAIVYAGLAGLIATVYLAVVLGVASLVPDTVTSVLATVLVAVAFAPARRQLTRLARRLVYGIRATPYEALVALPRQLADTPAPDDVLTDIARILGTGLGVVTARVTARLEDGGHREAWWGEPADGRGGELIVVPVRHLGVTVGEVAVRSPADRALSGPERRLLVDLAAQAGPAIRGYALAADLRASRERLGAAQLAERRRLERDLHDGAQQQLVELAIRLARTAREAPPGLRADLDRCRQQAERCLTELRELSRGIHPPVLAARGLAAALRSRARELAVPVRIEADGIGRFDPVVELTAYFSCLEALANVAKHAGDARAQIGISAEEHRLVFEIRDDGAGFDPGRTRRGSGLVGLSDRLGAIGGTLQVESRPGSGTTVRGVIPLVDAAAPN